MAYRRRQFKKSFRGKKRRGGKGRRIRSYTMARGGIRL